MKKFVFSLLTVILSCCSLAAQESEKLPYWNNLEVYDVNKVPPHVIRIPYNSEKEAAKLNYQSSPYYRNLDGEWDFYYVETPSEAPDGVLLSLPEVPVEALPVGPRRGKIQVPGNMEFQGYGNPVYVNQPNEFKSNPPYAPTDYNPVGCYVRDFWIGENDLLTGADGSRHVFFKIGAVKSNCYLYINGKEVGYSEDSKTPAEFEITKYLRKGHNRVCVKVYRFCDGSYLECQDFWRVSGITRSVELYSTPKVFVKDFSVKAFLDTIDYTRGLLDIVVDYSTEVPQPMQVEVELRTPNGWVVAKKKKEVERKDWFTFFNAKDFDLDKVMPWNDETPNLYTLFIKLYDSKDSLVELLSSKVGFRTVQIKKLNGIPQVCLNGKPVEIRGVNRHEHSGYTGQYVPLEEMKRDIHLMKEGGVNAVRTCHYPDDEAWYNLCDAAGILVWDEANVESHAQGYGEHSLAKKEEWAEVMMYRCNNMYERDKNHPCVIVWSLGNECGNGVAMEKAYRFMKRKDANRPISYERAELAWNSDIVGIMYPGVEYLSEYARGVEKRPSGLAPYIMVEYCHAMGNSVGGLRDYWDTIDKYPVLQGGFIWDWIDQSIIKTDEKGRTWHAVGGDLGNIPNCPRNDDAFCANGLIGSDGKPHQHYYHMKEVYKREYKYFDEDFSRFQKQPDPKAWEYQQNNPNHKVDIKKQKGAITLGNLKFSLRVNSLNGEIESYVIDGKEQLVSPIRPNFWRPPTLNDIADRNGASAWKGLDKLQYELVSCKTQKVKSQSTPAVAEVVMTYRLVGPDGQTMMMREIVEVEPEGTFQLSFRLEPQGAFRTLPKMGVQMGIDTTFCNVYGRGTGEVYADRRSAIMYSYDVEEFGLGNTTRSMVGEMHVVPQESGNRESFKLHIGKTATHGLNVYSNGRIFNFSIRQYADSTLTRCTRINQLPDPLPYYLVNIDHRQQGLGTGTCGPDVRSMYQLSGDSIYTYQFTFGFNTNDTTLMFPVNSKVYEPLATNKKPSPIKNVKASALPYDRYGAGFPRALFDGKKGVAGDWGNAWMGFYGLDSLIVEIEMNKATDMGSMQVGICDSPRSWVLLPNAVEAQYSKDGVHYSEWLPLSLPGSNATTSAVQANAVASNPNASVNERKVFSLKLDKKAKKVSYLRLRIRPQKFLPEGHEYAGDRAWLMVDEIEVLK